jgi:predicted GNAT family acetyltransferase
MTIGVVELRDPREATAQVHQFLAAEPSHHNLALSILGQSREQGLEGRYWIVEHDGCVVGFALQSPPGMRVILAQMDVGTARVLAESIEPPLPGVMGETAEASAFAATFALAHHVPVVDPDPGRLFQLSRVRAVAPAPGAPRVATSADRDLVIRWLVDFAGDTDDPAAPHLADEADRRIARGAFWLWDDGEPACLVGIREPAAGYARIGPVYTPPDRRGRGYAASCVAHTSTVLADRGLRCVLYTQLSNPTANAIYHRVGYRPIGEVISYGFG